MVLYKNNLDCIKELEIDIPKIDFGGCYDKVKINYKIEEELIIGLIINKTNNKAENYYFFDPISGQKLETSIICKDENITITNKIVTIINNTKIDMDSIYYFTNQNINIFNISDEFYTDICYHFESPNGKDVTLKDRVLMYFPNITLCDSCCIFKGVNLTTLESKCLCTINEIMNTDFFGNNAIINSAIREITDFFEESNLLILKCYKDVFNKYYIIKCHGVFIIYGILLFELIFSLVFFIEESDKISKYFHCLAEYYLHYIDNKVNKNKKTYKTQNSHKSNKSDKTEVNIITNKKEPPLRNIRKTQTSIIRKPTNKKISFSPSIYDYNESKKAFPLKLYMDKDISIHKEKIPIRKRLKTNTSVVRKNNIGSNVILNSISIQKPKKHEIVSKKKLKEIKKVCGKVNFEEYLKTDIQEMDFEDAFKNDKRSFCETFLQRLPEKIIFIDTFWGITNIRPVSIKLLLLLIYINLYFFVNALFFSENYISERFHDTSKEKYFSFMTRILNRLTWITTISSILTWIIECIFVEEKKIKNTLIREGNYPISLKSQISIIITAIRKGYKIFIGLCFSFGIISWYYISCFNNVYPYTKKEWIKSSIAMLIIRQFLQVLLVLIESVLRILSYRYKSEKIYKLMKFIE